MWGKLMNMVSKTSPFFGVGWLLLLANASIAENMPVYPRPALTAESFILANQSEPIVFPRWKNQIFVDVVFDINNENDHDERYARIAEASIDILLSKLINIGTSAYQLIDARRYISLPEDVEAATP